MKNVASYADEFSRRAASGEKPVVRVGKEYAEAFLGQLSRNGIEFAKDCLKNISDPELRRIIEAIFFSTVAGALAGAAIGGMVAGPAGAKVGAALGAGGGLVAGCVAVIITARQEEGPKGPELVLSVK
jgi:hypothetical protein